MKLKVTADLDRSRMKGHRAAEDHTRSGLLNDGDCGVVWIVKECFWEPNPKEILMEKLGKNLRKKRFPGRRSTAAGGKGQPRRDKIYRPREKYIEVLLPKNFIGDALAAAERKEKLTFCTCQDRFVKCKSLDFSRSGTPRENRLKGEPTPAWDHGARGSSSFWQGEGRVPGENVAALELVAFSVGEPEFLQAGRGSADGKLAQSTTAPTKVFFKFSQSLRRPPTAGCNFGSSHSIGSSANQPTGSSVPSPTWSEKVLLHLPLGGVLREGTW